MRYRRQIKDKHGVWNTSPTRFDESMIELVYKRIWASSLHYVRYIDTETGKILTTENVSYDLTPDKRS